MGWDKDITAITSRVHTTIISNAASVDCVTKHKVSVWNYLNLDLAEELVFGTVLVVLAPGPGGLG